LAKKTFDIDEFNKTPVFVDSERAKAFSAFDFLDIPVFVDPEFDTDFYLLTESSDFLMTEQGDNIIWK